MDFDLALGVTEEGVLTGAICGDSPVSKFRFLFLTGVTNWWSVGWSFGGTVLGRATKACSFSFSLETVTFTLSVKRRGQVETWNNLDRKIKMQSAFCLLENIFFQKKNEIDGIKVRTFHLNFLCFLFRFSFCFEFI